MIKEEADRLAREQKIDISQIVREEWEIKVLQTFFGAPIGNKVFFKGGTALRLGFGSPRFSEDLDFSVSDGQTIAEAEVLEFAERVVSTYREVAISDQQMKFNTALVEFKISDPLFSRSFALKVEISTRPSRLTYAPMLLISPTTNIQVLGSVETLDSLYSDKLETLGNRGKPRDLFDLWYICQKTKETLPLDLPKISKREIRQELNRFLPVNFTSVVKDLEDRYGN